jgi:hypothetical protein
MINQQSNYAIDVSILSSNVKNVHDLIPICIDHYQQIWWDSGTDLPVFELNYQIEQQKEFEKQLDRESSILINAAKHMNTNEENLTLFENNARLSITRLCEEMFHMNSDSLTFIENVGIMDSALLFFRMARDFDPRIPVEDIYQAGRNVITANLIQLLLGLPVQVTPSLFAYSMLYPYTDNYLDDPEIPYIEKKTFNQKFRSRLTGGILDPGNFHEKIIDSLIRMIESEWDRQNFPMVYESLLTIHTAQCKSLDLVAPYISPYEKDILGITFEKGGTSVLTDGFLVAGNLTYSQARTLFGFGAFTQLMDDMEDISSDIRDDRASLFSVSAPFWKLDSLCNRFFHFGRQTINDLDMFPGLYVKQVTDLITKCIDPMLLGSIGRSIDYFTRLYIQTLETHLPFRFASIEKQREKLKRYKPQILQLVEASVMK